MTRARLLVACLSLCGLGGCASLWYAGESDYTVQLPDGATIIVHSGKQQQSVNAQFKKTADGYVLTLNETGVQAFSGQSVAAGAAANALGTAAGAAINALKIIK